MSWDVEYLPEALDDLKELNGSQIIQRQTLMRKGLPFEVTAEGADPLMMQKLLEADSDSDIHGPFHTVQALMADLNADD